MGSGRWDTANYAAATSLRAAKGIDDFAYSSNTAAQPVTEWKAHPDLDPNGMTIRESRDSTEHPNSVGISVLFDVTGSMLQVPQAMQKRLPDLLNALLLSGYIEDPQICMGAIGDGYSDRVPLQVGQFESDNRIDDQLRNVFLEGNGGGTGEESYELGFYFAARHTVLDCVEKRDKKGYLFMVGDELPYSVLRPRIVQKVFGSDLLGGEDVPIEALVAEAQEKFNIFFIIPGDTHHAGEERLTQTWENLLGPNAIQVSSSDYMVETISTLIGLTEGKADMAAAIASVKAVNPDAAAAVESAVAKYASTLVSAPAVDDDPDGDTVRV